MGGTNLTLICGAANHASIKSQSEKLYSMILLYSTVLYRDTRLYFNHTISPASPPPLLDKSDRSVAVVPNSATANRFAVCQRNESAMELDVN